LQAINHPSVQRKSKSKDVAAFADYQIKSFEELSSIIKNHMS